MEPLFPQISGQKTPLTHFRWWYNKNQNQRISLVLQKACDGLFWRDRLFSDTFQFCIKKSKYANVNIEALRNLEEL